MDQMPLGKEGSNPLGDIEGISAPRVFFPWIFFLFFFPNLVIPLRLSHKDTVQLHLQSVPDVEDAAAGEGVLLLISPAAGRSE